MGEAFWRWRRTSSRWAPCPRILLQRTYRNDVQAHLHTLVVFCATHGLTQYRREAAVDAVPAVATSRRQNSAPSVGHSAHTRAMPEGAIDPIAAFAPFSPDEWARLERYRDRTRKLYECAFIQHSQTKWSLSGETGKPVLSTVEAGDERDLHEALLLFRPLWLQEENAGFARVQAMVKRHAHDKGTDEARLAIDAVKTYTKSLDIILSEPQLITLRERRVNSEGAIVSEEEVTPRRVFDDFLYGLYFHEEDDRIRRIGEWLHSDAQRFIFLTTLRHVARVYTAFAGTPVAILREPALRAGS